MTKLKLLDKYADELHHLLNVSQRTSQVISTSCRFTQTPFDKNLRSTPSAERMQLNVDKALFAKRLVRQRLGRSSLLAQRSWKNSNE